MIYWTREIIGWALVGLGLYIFYVSYFELIRAQKIFYSIPVTFMGFIVFRGGIHLVKVAAAIRISREGLPENRRGALNAISNRPANERRPTVPGTPSLPRSGK